MFGVVVSGTIHNFEAGHQLLVVLQKQVSRICAERNESNQLRRRFRGCDVCLWVVKRE